METDKPVSRFEEVDIQNLNSEFLSLKVGEEIPRLKIASIKKVTNPNSEDNLSGVDYKYLILSRDGKVLKVNAWVFWKQISAALKKADTIQVDLELKHTGIQEYSVKVL